MKNWNLAVVATSLLAGLAGDSSAQIQRPAYAPPGVTAARNQDYRDKIEAIRARLPVSVPHVTRPSRVRIKAPATGQLLGMITLFPPAADGLSYADWPVFAAVPKEGKEGGDRGCGDDRFRFEPLPLDENRIPELEVEDIPLNPDLIKKLKEFMSQKANICDAAVGVYSGGHLIQGAFHLLPNSSSTGFDSGLPGRTEAMPAKGSVTTAEAKTITCECVLTKADRNSNSTSTCVCNAKDYQYCENCCAYYIRMQEKTGGLVRNEPRNTVGFDTGLANNCTSAPCPWQTGQWPWTGTLTGNVALGLQVGIADETRQLVTITSVGPDGSFQLPAPRRPIRGVPVVCVVKSGAAPVCGNPGNPEPLIAGPGFRIQVSRLPRASEQIRQR